MMLLPLYKEGGAQDDSMKDNARTNNFLTNLVI
jgi:hypothetical protein